MACAPKRRARDLAAFGAAVGHRQRARFTAGEMRGGQLDHLAGADKQHVDLAEVLEQLLRQAHRRGRHADRVGADVGGAAHFLGHRESALEQLVQRAAHGAGQAGFAHRLLDLTEDLRLTQHHRIQPRRHSEDMARGFAALRHLRMLGQRRALRAALFGQPVQCRAHQFLRVLALAGGHVQLGAVAGGQQGHFGRGAAEPFAQRTQRQRQPFGRKRELAAQVQWRAVVVQAESENAHVFGALPSEIPR